MSMDDEADELRATVIRVGRRFVIVLGSAALIWLLAAPANLWPTSGVARNDAPVTCDRVLSAGPSDHIFGGHDGVERRETYEETMLATQAACDALRARRVGWSILIAVPLTVAMARKPPPRAPLRGLIGPVAPPAPQSATPPPPSSPRG